MVWYENPPPPPPGERPALRPPPVRIDQYVADRQVRVVAAHYELLGLAYVLSLASGAHVSVPRRVAGDLYRDSDIGTRDLLAKASDRERMGLILVRALRVDGA